MLEAKIERQDDTLADLVLVTEETLVRDAISFMREKDVSQLLVTVTAELPLAAKEVSGSLSELGLLGSDDARLHRCSILRLKDIADPSLPMVGVGMSVSELTRLLSTTAGVLVLDGGHPVGVSTRSDLLSFLEQKSDKVNGFNTRAVHVGSEPDAVDRRGQSRRLPHVHLRPGRGGRGAVLRLRARRQPDPGGAGGVPGQPRRGALRHRLRVGPRR